MPEGRCLSQYQIHLLWGTIDRLPENLTLYEGQRLTSIAPGNAADSISQIFSAQSWKISSLRVYGPSLWITFNGKIQQRFVELSGFVLMMSLPQWNIPVSFIYIVIPNTASSTAPIKSTNCSSASRRMKQPAVAMTDHGNMFGAIEFYREAMSHGIKPIIGCEIYVAPTSRFEKKGVDKGPKEYNNHLILLAMNNEGYRNLCKLVSLGYMEGFYYKPRIDKELLREFNGGLIAFSACLQGEVSRH